LLFQPDDILIFRAEKTSSLPKDILGSNDVPEAAVEEANVFFLYRCCDKNSELYRMCKKLVDESNIRGNGHAIYQGIITEVENKINQLCVKNFNEMDTVIEDTVTAKAQSGDIDEMASLFNSVSFRDFVMTGYKQKCAITGNVIQYKSFMNLEAAHIWPRSHKGLYLPSNGIALCRDMHWAFDKGMFTIGDDFKIIVHPDVESDYLQQYNNKSLYIPENAFFRPDINNLHYHQTHIYGLFKTSGSLVKATGYYKNINMAAEDKTPYGSN
jgi:predicted restriction endonuclease